MGIWELNRRILEMYNSCSYADFESLMDDLVKADRGVNIARFFRSRWYLWNWIRPRDFYKMMARYIVEKVGSHEFDRAEFMLNLILEDQRVPEKVKQTFVWGITKQIPLITMGTLRYMSAERIHNMLTGHKEIVSDEFLRPVLMVILSYRDRLAELQSRGGTTIEDNDL